MAKKNKNFVFDLLVSILTVPFLIVCFLIYKIVDNILISLLITAVLFVVVGGFLLSKVFKRPSANLSIDSMEGHDFEYWCADLLRRNGFVQVDVTRGSGDQGVDVIAVKDGKKYAIQCKRYNQKLGNKPVQEVHAGKTIYGCNVAVVMTNNYFTDGGKEAARALGVELWDRDVLRRMLVYAEHREGSHIHDSMCK